MKTAFEVIKGSPEFVGQKLSELEGRMVITSDGQPVWSAPSMTHNGEVIIIVKLWKP